MHDLPARSGRTTQEEIMPDPIIADGPSARARVINGLREATDYLDRHPAVPVSGHGWTLHSFPARGSDDAGRAAVDEVAATLGVSARDDTADGGHYRAVKSFGLVTYEFVHVSSAYRAASDAVMSSSGSVTPARLPGAA
jgi:hypothetical protein